MDLDILKNCLEEQPRGWENFVDRFTGLVFHVIDHICKTRHNKISPSQRESLCEAVFTALRHDQYRLLKQYRGSSTVSGFLTVIVQRIVIRNLNNEHGEIA